MHYSTIFSIYIKNFHTGICTFDDTHHVFLRNGINQLLGIISVFGFLRLWCKGRGTFTKLGEAFRCRLLGHVAIPVIQLIFFLPFSIYAAISFLDDSARIYPILFDLMSVHVVMVSLVAAIILRLHGSPKVQQMISLLCCCGWRHSVQPEDPKEQNLLGLADEEAFLSRKILLIYNSFERLFFFPVNYI